MRWSQPLARRGKLLCDLRLSGSNRRFEFQKRAQLFIHTHDETFSAAAMRVCNGRLFAVGSTVVTQPQLQPALLRLSAMIPSPLRRKFPSKMTRDEYEKLRPEEKSIS